MYVIKSFSERTEYLIIDDAIETLEKVFKGRHITVKKQNGMKKIIHISVQQDGSLVGTYSKDVINKETMEEM